MDKQTYKARIFIALSFTTLSFWQTGLAQKNKPVLQSILALEHAIIYPSPVDSAIRDGVVIVTNDKITAIGKSDKVKIPQGAKIINCKGLTITAGFWNSHVHFTAPEIANAQGMTDADLANYLKLFLTKYGVAHVFDIGSLPANTLAIRQRIESGAVMGPSIFTTGLPLAPPHGTPFYVRALHITLEEPANTTSAATVVNKYLRSGLDGIKIFSGSPQDGKPEIIMPKDIAIAITKAAHAKGKLVFAHPSVNEGLQVAVESNVDIIAHTTPDGGKPWDSMLIRQMITRKTCLIPTLKLWKWSLQQGRQSQDAIDRFMAIAIGQVKNFSEAGGILLFGTDIGFMDDYNPQDEYVFLQKAGLSFRQILATLTTAPAQKFGLGSKMGKIAIGMNADFVIFSGDPQKDIKVLTDVKYTLRNGEIIYTAE